jgi:hypothetical protein
VASGNNYSLHGDTIRFFDQAGNHGDGTRWRISFFGSSPSDAVDPSDSMPAIRQIIMGDVNNGRGDDIAALVVAPGAAVLLFLEGVITAQHLNGAQEPAENIVDIPGVFIEGRTLTVRVAKDAAHTIATADAQGQLIP